MILILGGSGSGKSAYAEKRITEICKEKGLRMYYLATMKVYGAEEELIVEKHRQLRAGKGFITVEQPTDLSECISKFDGMSGALLECASNLAANEMFSGESPEEEEKVAEKICRDIKRLDDELEEFVVVSNNIFDDGTEYDEVTLSYIRALGRVNQYMARIAGEVWECVAGIPVKIK